MKSGQIRVEREKSREGRSQEGNSYGKSVFVRGGGHDEIDGGGNCGLGGNCELGDQQRLDRTEDERFGGAVGNSLERRDKGLFDLGEGFPGETNFGRGNRNCGVNITQKRGAENLEDRGGLGVVNFGDLGQGGDYFGLNENGGGRGNSLGDFVR